MRGYEDAANFSKDYKRYSGEPPMRHVERLRETATPTIMTVTPLKPGESVERPLRSTLGCCGAVSPSDSRYGRRPAIAGPDTNSTGSTIGVALAVGRMPVRRPTS